MLFHLSQGGIAVACYSVGFKEVFLGSLMTASQSQALCSQTSGVEFFSNSAPSPVVADLCFVSVQDPEPSSFFTLQWQAAFASALPSKAMGLCLGLFSPAQSLWLLLHMREGVMQGVAFMPLCHPQGLSQVSCPAPSLAYRWRPKVKNQEVTSFVSGTPQIPKLSLLALKNLLQFQLFSS